MVDVSWSQPSLQLGPPPAVRLVFEALIDPDDQTVVLSVEARTFPGRELISLAASAPIPFFMIEETARLYGTDFTKLLREHTAPF